MCTPDYHPSSPARFKSSKTVKVKKFPLLKDVNKPPLFRRGHSATTARVFWPPATRRTSPFRNIPLFNPYQPFNFTSPIHFLLTHVQRLYLHVCLFILKSAWNNPAHTGRIFMRVDILRKIRKSVQKIQVSLKSDKNDGYFTWRPPYIFYHTSLSFSRMRNVSDRNCR